MDTRTDKLIQQAGKFIQQGKFSHALEQYLKAHQLNPGETTILNMIGDLYVRPGKEAEALLWYTGNALLFPSQARPVGSDQGSVQCQERLGGLLKYYYREAA
jgi:Tfp pilus assembly protein PilF